MRNMQDLGNCCGGLTEAEITELEAISKLYSESNGLIIKLAAWAGRGAEGLLHKAPEEWQSLIGDATELALKESYRLAANTQVGEDASLTDKVLAWAQGERWHMVATAVTGALGGAGGIGTTLVDLPVTTTLIFRSIQQIAEDHGEDIDDETVRAQCIAVFGFGGPLAEDDDAETGLFASRMALTGKACAEMIKAVLPRFGAKVSEKVLAQATPVIGAVTGATLNAVFSSYYQTMAHVHFRLRKLERDHDEEQLKACFERIVRNRREAKKLSAARHRN